MSASDLDLLRGFAGPAPAQAASASPGDLSLLNAFNSASFGDPAAQDADAPDVGMFESFVRGAAQTASLGFADEITGLIESAFSGKSYKQARDESRANYDAAAAANPIASMAGSIAGGFVPLPGAALRAAGKGVQALSAAGKGGKIVQLAQKLRTAETTGAAVLRGALEGATTGAVAGYGASTEGNALGSTITGAAVGGGLGGAMGGVLGGAKDRLQTKVIREATDGAKYSLRDKAARNADDVFEVVMEKTPEAKKLRNALGISGTGFIKGRNTDEIVEAADDMIKGAAERNASAYRQFDAANDGGLRVVDLLKSLRKKRKEYFGNPATHDEANRLRAIEARIEASWLPKRKAKETAEAYAERVNDVRRKSIEIREFVTRIQSQAFEGQVDPTTLQAVRRQVSRDMRDVFEDALGSVALRGGKVDPRLKGALDDILADNRKITALAQIRDAAKFAQTRETSRSTRLRDITSGAVDLGLLGTGNLGGLAAKKALQVALPRLDAATSVAALRLVEAAKRGTPRAKLIQMAVESGLPTAAAERAAELYSSMAGAE